MNVKALNLVETSNVQSQHFSFHYDPTKTLKSYARQLMPCQPENASPQFLNKNTGSDKNCSLSFVFHKGQDKNIFFS